MTLEEQLVRDEGVRLKPYTDSVGKRSIGVGRNLDDVGITIEEAFFLRDNDILKVKIALVAALPWVAQLDDARRGALENMAYNMGVRGLLKFKNTLALVQTGKYEEAAAAMLQSRWAKQVGPRADRLAEQMKTGEWR